MIQFNFSNFLLLSANCHWALLGAGQVAAIQLGISRELQNWAPDLRPPLREGTFTWSSVIFLNWWSWWRNQKDDVVEVWSSSESANNIAERISSSGASHHFEIFSTLVSGNFLFLAFSKQSTSKRVPVQFCSKAINDEWN